MSSTATFLVFSDFAPEYAERMHCLRGSFLWWMSTDIGLELLP